MRHDWILGLGAVSALALLASIDLLVSTVTRRGQVVSTQLLASVTGARRPRR